MIASSSRPRLASNSLGGTNMVRSRRQHAAAEHGRSVASFSFLNHFDQIKKGVIDLRDLIFFVSDGRVLFANTCSISRKGNSHGERDQIPPGIIIATPVVAFIFLFAVNAFEPDRAAPADFTQDKTFTFRGPWRRCARCRSW